MKWLGRLSGKRWLEDVRRDFGYALRTFQQKACFSVIAICNLAVGTGATTIIFSLVNSVLLKPLDYPEPDRLVGVHGHTAAWNAAIFGEQNVAYPDFVDFERASRSLEIGGFLYNGATLSAPGDAQYVDRREVSSNLFSVLRIPLLSGRAFRA